MNSVITYKKNIGLDELASQLSNQNSLVTSMSSDNRNQDCAITRFHVLKEFGAEIFVKMKKKLPKLSEKMTFCGGKIGEATAKIQFAEGKYNDKVFGVLKNFFIQKKVYLRGPEFYDFDNVSLKKAAGKEYMIKDQELVNEKI